MKYVIIIEADDTVEESNLHESLCQTIHEGQPMTVEVLDIQVVGSIQNT